MATHKKIKINIRLPEQDASKLLISHIHKRLNELPKTLREIYSADVRFRYDKTGDVQNKICEIYLVTAGKNMFTMQMGKTFGEAAFKAIDKLQKQLSPEVLPPAEELPLETLSSEEALPPESSEQALPPEEEALP